MTNFNGIALEYRNEKRDNYMSVYDLIKDLTTDCLVSILPTLETLNHQMALMTELEKRNELSIDKYFELLDTCNGI